MLFTQRKNWKAEKHLNGITAKKKKEKKNGMCIFKVYIKSHMIALSEEQTEN